MSSNRMMLFMTIVLLSGCSGDLLWQKQLATKGKKAEELSVANFRGDDAAITNPDGSSIANPDIVAMVNRGATFKAIAEHSSGCQADLNQKLDQLSDEYINAVDDAARSAIAETISRQHPACVQLHKFMFRAGVALSNDICRLYFHEADVVFANKQQFDSTLVALNTLFAAGLGLAGAPGAIVGAVGAGLGVAQGYSQETINNYVFRTDAQDVYGLITKNRDKYLTQYKDNILGIESHYTSRDLLQHYHDLCSPGRIRDQIKVAITSQSIVLQPSEAVSMPTSRTALLKIQDEISGLLEGHPIVSTAGLIGSYAYFISGVADAKKAEAIADYLVDSGIAIERDGVITLNADETDFEDSRSKILDRLRLAGEVEGMRQQLEQYMAGVAQSLEEATDGDPVASEDGTAVPVAPVQQPAEQNHPAPTDPNDMLTDPSPANPASPSLPPLPSQ